MVYKIRQNLPAQPNPADPAVGLFLPIILHETHEQGMTTTTDLMESDSPLCQPKHPAFILLAFFRQRY